MTNPPTDERRETFEKYAVEMGVIIERSKHDPDSYKFQWASDGWKAWQLAFPEAALFHRGEALYEVENSGLRKGLKLGYEMGQEGLSELFNTTLASWEREAKEMRQENHLTALISKAEKQ